MSAHVRRDYAVGGLAMILVGCGFLAPIWLLPAQGLALVVLVFLAGIFWIFAIELFVAAARGRITARDENSAGMGIINLFFELFTKR